ncbi:hypothetical protein GE21DRAFT_6726 [Neurospora crassa]|uniref:Zn(2)-C6 fungal-type domain-containing protein n=1 Tax=Neurospora crassa (strain ATCC 24698 / 74-OR23-1A / CBS 708.71 / DSM 1257 / FGSC 987) TaxID=367110 RepID=Q7S9C5_NEUCR|nr:hypothetical protein NCU05208 [Neurospora crassa OR74A]EAA32971.2 hypothetical protein NCU05208 [Neurospora crassa OR74A]KHE85406.1 hypothetical protein GE21DRAFT_6726 [Neurospora crassa]|eukprot:XP_962207.2 hypothetical protein NCU05208 [Neurospora crassa OR74A]
MAASSSTRKSIQPHRKSRTGCSSCKRRKVKCDEEKPCSNCIRFGLPCNLVPENAHFEHGIVGPAAPTRRGRGRPRKNWADPPHSQSTPSTTPTSPLDDPTPLNQRACVPTTTTIDLNITQAELLLHFTTTTAPSIGGCDKHPHHLAFWTRNALHIGLAHPFVLHLLLADTAFHLAYLTATHHHEQEEVLLLPPRRSHSEYLALAQQHLTEGVSGFAAELARPGEGNCGALYLGAVLLCFCTFADGPRGDGDLLVCSVDGDGDGDEGCGLEEVGGGGVSMPFVYGVRLMHQTFRPEVLFAGLMEPLGRDLPPSPLDTPVYVRDGFPRVEWEEQLDGLREFVVARAQEGGAPNEGELSRTTAAVAVHALDNLIGIYAAIYGRRGPDGEIRDDGPPHNQFVFGWLYRVEPEFAACVRRCDPSALLVLAHYAVLLNRQTTPSGWFLKGWKEHIIARVGVLLGESETSKWMRWPMERIAPEEKE